jgi:hypothetical protein
MKITIIRSFCAAFDRALDLELDTDQCQVSSECKAVEDITRGLRV